MNNVHAIVLRAVGSCLRHSPWPRPTSAPSCAANLARKNTAQFHTIFAQDTRHSRVGFQAPISRQSAVNSIAQAVRPFHSSIVRRALRPTTRSSQSKPTPNVEQGLQFREKSLSSRELRDVYGEVCPPPSFANRLLRVLHARRVDGTLDLPLPADITSTLKRYPYAQSSALNWLRTNYSVDEDEAILARIDREDADVDFDTPSELMERGQGLGLYGPQTGRYNEPPVSSREDPIDNPTYYGPQSGRYKAQLGEEGDIFGQSELEKIRAKNEAEAAREEEELEKQIAQIQEKEVERRSQDTALASRPEQGVEAAQAEVRPPNEFEKWILRAKNRSTTKLTLESPEILNKTMTQRLLPSFLFVGIVCAGLYAFTESWVPPKRSERIWPNMSLSFATVAGILAVNASIWLCWRFPPAWPLLNRYFVVVPALPKPLSLLGNIFSHVGAKHLLVNAVPLIVFGPSLHEDLGRANFLAIYIASGVIGSYISLARYVTQGVLVTSALGASGCTWGITGAFLSLHAHDKFTVFLLPEDLKERISVQGWMFLLGLLTIEVVGVFTGRLQRAKVDYVAHFSGATVGWLFGEVWKHREAISRDGGNFVPKPTRPWWAFFQRETDSSEKRS